jgi:hypothetical protein
VNEIVVYGVPGNPFVPSVRMGLTPEGRGWLEGTSLAKWLARMNQRPSMSRTQRPESLRAVA